MTINQARQLVHIPARRTLATRGLGLDNEIPQNSREEEFNSLAQTARGLPEMLQLTRTSFTMSLSKFPYACPTVNPTSRLEKNYTPYNPFVKDPYGAQRVYMATRSLQKSTITHYNSHLMHSSDVKELLVTFGIVLSPSWSLGMPQRSRYDHFKVSRPH